MIRAKNNPEAYFIQEFMRAEVFCSFHGNTKFSCSLGRTIQKLKIFIPMFFLNRKSYSWQRTNDYHSQTFSKFSLNY